MSRVNINDLTVERNLDSRESAVVGGARVAIRFGGSSYPYSDPYGCEPDYGYDYGYTYPQFNFGYGNFGHHGHGHHHRGHHGHSRGRRGRHGGHGGHGGHHGHH